MSLRRLHFLFFGPLQIQPQQLLQNLFIAQIKVPAVRREDGLVEELVGEVELGGTLVI
jgi:hypothetical protein